VEWLGNETYAYIPYDAPPEVAEQLRQLERDLDGEALHTQLVAALSGSSRIREGEEAEIWVDASRIHLFDPESGRNLTVDAANAGTIPDLATAG
jgi:multiple sugar transport system ATP-binding protein